MKIKCIVQSEMQMFTLCPLIYQGARPKRILKIQLLATKKKIGTTTWTLDDAWCDVSKKWPNVTQDEYILTEDDGTEIISDDHYQALDHKATLQLCLKSAPEGTH